MWRFFLIQKPKVTFNSSKLKLNLVWKLRLSVSLLGIQVCAVIINGLLNGKTRFKIRSVFAFNLKLKYKIKKITWGPLKSYFLVIGIIIFALFRGNWSHEILDTFIFKKCEKLIHFFEWRSKNAWRFLESRSSQLSQSAGISSES